MKNCSQEWPLGVSASLDTGDGVSLDVARELGVSTIHLPATLFSGLSAFTASTNIRAF